MKIAYFDCFAGASGDMILGALVDAGLDPDLLNRELAQASSGSLFPELQAGCQKRHRRLPGCR